MHFNVGKALLRVPARNLKGEVHRKFEEGSEATEESPKEVKRGWSRSRDMRQDFGE